ncbi:MAG: hypothetical protein IKM08_06960 [Clostridia bacterium]|nr:hypothetical protein [Clostridia bacterium]
MVRKHRSRFGAVAAAGRCQGLDPPWRSPADCQTDAFLPIRVKGRDKGTPQWGQYEILTDKGWAEYRA